MTFSGIIEEKCTSNCVWRKDQLLTSQLGCMFHTVNFFGHFLVFLQLLNKPKVYIHYKLSLSAAVVSDILSAYVDLHWWSTANYIYSTNVLKYKFRYLCFTWVYIFSATLYFYCTTSKRQMLYSLLHCICWTTLVTSYRFFIPFVSSENHLSPNLLNLNVSDKLQDWKWSFIGWDIKMTLD